MNLYRTKFVLIRMELQLCVRFPTWRNIIDINVWNLWQVGTCIFKKRNRSKYHIEQIHRYIDWCLMWDFVIIQLAQEWFFKLLYNCHGCMCTTTWAQLMKQHINLRFKLTEIRSIYCIAPSVFSNVYLLYIYIYIS
jgi:hypothetical protein